MTIVPVVGVGGGVRMALDLPRAKQYYSIFCVTLTTRQTLAERNCLENV